MWYNKFTCPSSEKWTMSGYPAGRFISVVVEEEASLSREEVHACHTSCTSLAQCVIIVVARILHKRIVVLFQYCHRCSEVVGNTHVQVSMHYLFEMCGSCVLPRQFLVMVICCCNMKMGPGAGSGRESEVDSFSR